MPGESDTEVIETALGYKNEKPIYIPVEDGKVIKPPEVTIDYDPSGNRNYPKVTGEIVDRNE